MSILEIIKDIFAGPNASFEKLLMPDYFSNKRQEFDSIQEYAKWLRGILTQFGSMAFIKKNQGLQVPEKWLDGIRKIEAEIERVKIESGPNLFPVDNGSKMSETLR